MGSRDTERVEGVAKMIESGYISQLLLSHDVFVKTSFRKYGGYGYDHLLTHVVPMMHRKGIYQDKIDQMIIENPMKAQLLWEGNRDTRSSTR